MRRAARTGWLLVLGGSMALVSAGPAEADQSNTGGFGTPARPRIVQVSCEAPSSHACRRGEVLIVSGDALDGVRSVVFLGRAGRSDDRRATPQDVGAHQLSVTVPDRAHSGRLRAVAASASATGPRVTVRAARPTEATAPTGAPAPDGGVFPIRGRHDLGQTATNDFGGSRNHKGQDMFASCGTPLIAALGGTVTEAKFDSRAGNYAVVTDASGQSEVYMHMRSVALVTKGETVTTGQPLGEVGDTGAAEGCHLHFELWTAPGWYQGGRAIDPLPTLKRWDAQS